MSKRIADELKAGWSNERKWVDGPHGPKGENSYFRMVQRGDFPGIDWADFYRDWLLKEQQEDDERQSMLAWLEKR